MAVKCCTAVAVVEVCGGDAVGCGITIDNGTQTDLISVIFQGAPNGTIFSLIFSK